MNIKDIARLAGVSPSTVSKIMNNNDGNISQKTREKVLEIVNKYQYMPYAKAMSNNKQRTRLIGALVPDIADSYYANILKRVEISFAEKGYNVIVCSTQGRADGEIAALELLLQRGVECLLFFDEFLTEEMKEKIIQSGLPYIITDVNAAFDDSIKIHFNFSKSIEMIIDHLYENAHERIAMIIYEKDTKMARYYENEIIKRKKFFDKSLVFYLKQHDQKKLDEIFEILAKTQTTAIIAGSTEIAMEIYKQADERHFKIPEDFSVVTFDDKNHGEYMIPEMTGIKFPFDEIAQKIVEIAMSLLHRLESHKNEYTIDTVFCPGRSVMPARNNTKGKIVVIGSVNMDVMLEVKEVPKIGETVMIHGIQFHPGGKGANQAIAAARLGGNVSIIGKLGNDLHGKDLYNNLIMNNVDIKGLAFDNQNETGTAYIYVSEDAEFSMGFFSGANYAVDISHLEKFEQEIRCSQYCLVQSEMPNDSLRYIMDACRKGSTRVILKPSPTKNVDDYVLDGVYLAVVNESELEQLLGGDDSFESKSARLLQKGVRHVVCTRGEIGGYYTSADCSYYFNAAPIKSVDTSGASDVFIATLAVFLTEGHALDYCLQLANIAAGISTARVGVQTALPDRRTILDFYNRKNAATLR